jgi:methylphosphotriester-DNA--protein-cysteine methyltransferase
MPLRCPVCKAENTQGPACRRCKADLSMLFALDEKRAQALATARAALAERRWEEARTAAKMADHLRHDDESKELVAVTALVCGDFHEAWRLHRELMS